MPYKQRLTIDITDKQAKGLSKHLEHGMRKLLFHAIIDDLLRLFDKHGSDRTIGALVSRAISLKDICKLNVKE